ncbi:FAD-dependent oxidoreductase [Nocardiopsis trehalosi]|jgi:2-polyprenyl-6-methoxyphenol hydroxylase-like FAD-dependent oxidoreductase|uniref:FAD-dependent oxidoreductase n=1 Tax=Nocardiopsis trehalosi TaxID=109329 RepID=UPI000833DA79|nr:FAD-dependent oxidoreductase [Nocardiopsis trehalosi]
MAHTETTTVAVSGGGPAGIMLGLLLARAGVDVTVLEKHGDFLRDFRGDTVHPSTLQLMAQLGLMDELERIPHRKLTTVTIGNPEQTIVAADLAELPGAYRHIAMIPQWDFLDLLVRRARRYPGFHLRMNARATSLIEEGGGVRGVRYTTADADGGTEEHELRAVLTVSADGRHSELRRLSGLLPRELGAPMDVLWLRVPRAADGATSGLNGRLGAGAMAVAIDRGDYWQCAYLIPKAGAGASADIRDRPVTELQERLRELLPFLGDAVREVDDWSKVAFLKVGVDRLTRWYRPGYLCIGDAAHTMSPVGGIGINLAVQDAVAAANLLAGPLLRAQDDPDRFARTLNPALLARVQRRRLPATVGTQLFQQLVQRQILARALSAEEHPSLPLPLRLTAGTRAWSRVVGRVLSRGIRPETITTPEAPAAAAPGGTAPAPA